MAGATRRALITAAAAALGLAAAPASATPQGGDPLAAHQWSLAAANADPLAGDGAGVTVAVIGGGVADHPDLAPIAHRSCVRAGGARTGCSAAIRPSSEETSPSATHAAGVVAAHIDNGLGIRGVAPGASLLDLRVVERGVVRAEDVDAALAHAADAGADVALVVLPGAAATAPAPGADAVALALAAGVTVVGGAGSAAHVADADDALVVTSFDRGGRPTAGAPGRSRWVIAAPGGSGTGDPERAVVSTAADGGYDARAGTWVAAAHVAGAAAVLRADGVDAAGSAQRLVSRASPSPWPGEPDRLDVRAARGAPSPSIAPSPSAPASRPAQPALPVIADGSGTPRVEAEIDAPPGVLPYALPARPPPTVERNARVASGVRATEVEWNPLQLAAGAVLLACGVGAALLVRASAPGRRSPVHVSIPEHGG